MSRRRLISAARRLGRRRRVFDFANNYAGLDSIPEIAWFAEEVERTSEGRIQISFRNGWATPTDPAEEITLARDVACGRADFGWVGSRVFGKLGVTAFDSLEAPFLLGTRERQKRVLEGGITNEMLRALETIGLVGLAVYPGELRKPFGFRRPFLQTSDFQGAIIRTHESAVADATYAALGSTKVLLDAGVQNDHPPVDGMDLHPSALKQYGFGGFFTWNVNLWPRMPVIVMHRHRFESLPVATKDLIRTAAATSVRRALGTFTCDEGRAELENQEGLVIVESDGAQLAELRLLLETVHQGLRADPGAAGFLRRIEATVVPTGPC